MPAAPAGREADVTLTSGTMTSESEADAEAAVPAVESVTRIVTEAVPLVVGVPEICPVLVLMPRPDGRPVADQVYGVFPPPAAIWLEYT